MFSNASHLHLKKKKTNIKKNILSESEHPQIFAPLGSLSQATLSNILWYYIFKIITWIEVEFLFINSAEINSSEE